MGLKESGLRGSIRNVSTGIGAAITIDTLEAENIDNESATIRGEITALTNFGEQSEVFFEFGEDSAGLPNTTDIQEQGEVGIFTEELTGLETGESYEFQAFGSVRDVSDEGAILSFETDDFEISITTLEATNVDVDSATIRGEITQLENFGEDAEVFFEFGEITEGLPNTTDIQLQDTVGVFTEDLTNLRQGTTHEFQAFGSVQDVSDEGVVLTFETGAAIPNGAVAHYDATELNLSDGEPVTEWADVSGEGNDLTGGSPVYRVGELNGNAVVEFNGSDDELTMDGSVNVHSIVFVAEPDQSGNNSGLFGNGDNPVDYINPQSSLLRYRSDNSNQFTFPTDSSPNIYTIVFEDGSANAFRAGDPSGDNPQSKALLEDANNMGQARSDEVSHNGFIAEVIVWERTLSEGEREDVENLLAEKWGINI